MVRIFVKNREFILVFILSLCISCKKTSEAKFERVVVELNLGESLDVKMNNGDIVKVELSNENGFKAVTHLHGLLPRLGFFVGNEARIPYDFHEILACIAPRPVLVIAPLMDKDAVHKDIENCVENGIKVDFFMKTFHSNNYWSATPIDITSTELPEDGNDHNMAHDNIFCMSDKITADFFKENPTPWIAYKVLAAGAIKPEDGFRHAFASGADFACVGMFDFQLLFCS